MWIVIIKLDQMVYLVTNMLEQILNLKVFVKHYLKQ